MRLKILAVLSWLCISLPLLADPQYKGVERSVELKEKLTQAYLAKGIGYRPRTEHFSEDGTPLYTNRLILEDSPYLLQHAHNPVDWHPWSEAPFARAEREGKPVFLSIGYATCHWCHVMERESFEDPAIAALLNEHFIAVKVDRESHPAVDQVYMTAVMLVAGHGGWPMSSFLTPDGKPFFGGTYYPPDQFAALLKQVAHLWRESRKELEIQAARIAAAVAENNRLIGKAQAFDPATASQAVAAIGEIFDELQGGFGTAPKFPHEPWLFLLLDQAERRDDPQALHMLETTLDYMARGGIYDQVGGGFHRYATDPDWLVPHFEKMLYNQAHLSRIYLGAWRLTGQERYRRVATQTLDYVLREMTAPEGGFYSATDADSEGGEGRFFTWTPDEIRTALPPEEAALTESLYGVTRPGNFEGRNILHLAESLEDYAARQEMDLDLLRQRLDAINQTLRQTRERRTAPLRDEKILTAWNGMMITALAEAADLLGSPAYRRAAVTAADFLWQRNRSASRRLWRVRLADRSSVVGAQEDYAYFAEGLLALYDLTGERIWLERTEELADALLQRFLDGDQGGFFMSEIESDITAMDRPKDDGGDNATPSGSSVALRVLQRLGQRTDDPLYHRHMDALISRFAPSLERLPHNFGYMLTSILDRIEGELGEKGYAAQGGIRIKAGFTTPQNDPHQLLVSLDIPPGWHVNSDRPGHPDLIGTQVSLNAESSWKLGRVSYPKGEARLLGFQSTPVSLYTGRVEFLLQLESDSVKRSNLTLPVQVRLQACNEQTCLPPERVTLRVGLHHVRE